MYCTCSESRYFQILLLHTFSMLLALLSHHVLTASGIVSTPRPQSDGYQYPIVQHMALILRPAVTGFGASQAVTLSKLRAHTFHPAAGSAPAYPPTYLWIRSLMCRMWTSPWWAVSHIDETSSTTIAAPPAAACRLSFTQLKQRPSADELLPAGILPVRL